MTVDWLNLEILLLLCSLRHVAVYSYSSAMALLLSQAIQEENEAHFFMETLCINMQFIIYLQIM